MDRRKQRPNLAQQEADCRIIINLLDHVEERRPLTSPETNLRMIITGILSRVTNAKFLMWKQRSKVKAAIEGDENTHFFHACANQRHCRNKIQIIEHDGCEVYNHDQKAAILHSFYLDLLGSPSATSWGFSLNELYPEGAINLIHLDSAFDRDEIHLAFLHMHSNASPALMALGPCSSKPLGQPPLLTFFSLFDAFHSLTSDLARLNRSYLVLLPKKEDAHKPHGFRPIALQNSTVKGLSKVLT